MSSAQPDVTTHFLTLLNSPSAPDEALIKLTETFPELVDLIWGTPRETGYLAHLIAQQDFEGLAEAKKAGVFGHRATWDALMASNNVADVDLFELMKHEPELMGFATGTERGDRFLGKLVADGNMRALVIAKKRGLLVDENSHKLFCSDTGTVGGNVIDWLLQNFKYTSEQAGEIVKCIKTPGLETAVEMAKKLPLGREGHKKLLSVMNSATSSAIYDAVGDVPHVVLGHRVLGTDLVRLAVDRRRYPLLYAYRQEALPYLKDAITENPWVAEYSQRRYPGDTITESDDLLERFEQILRKYTWYLDNFQKKYGWEDLDNKFPPERYTQELQNMTVSRSIFFNGAALPPRWLVAAYRRVTKQ